MNTLFVYGIFLDADNREQYGMYNPRYAVVKDYVTYGDNIVAAYKQEKAGLALSGLVVNVQPDLLDVGPTWARLDALEAGYNRIVVTTTDGEQAYMYAGKEL